MRPADDPQRLSANEDSGAFVRHALVALFCFLILAGVKTFPLILRLGTHIYGRSDSLLNTWILAWDVHALTTGDPLRLFDANIFYPVERALALSEHMLGVMPIFAPVYLLTGNPVLGYNVVFLLSFALSGFGMFCFAYHWTRQFWPSLVAGTLFGFAPYRLGQLDHLQLQSVFWAPFALLFLDRFLRTQRWRHLIGFAGFYWLQVLSSVYLGYIVTVGVILYVGHHAVFVDRGLLRLSMLPKAVAFLGGSGAVLVPLFLPYLNARESWGFGRAIPEVVFFSPDIFSYLSAPRVMNDLYLSVFRWMEPAAVWEKRLFPGLVLPALAVLGSMGGTAVAVLDRGRGLRSVCWLIMAAAVMLSLGPYLVILGVQTQIPLPYLLLHHVVPGFSAMRVPGRFVLLALLAASPLAALGAIRCSAAVGRLLKSRAQFAPALTAASLIGLFLLELGWKPVPLARVPDDERTRGLYRWLSAERPGPIVELPFGVDDDYRYVYFATAHWLPLVNGVSGFFPSTYAEIRSAVGRLPTRQAVEYAGALGVKAIVVHSERLSPQDSGRWQEEATTQAGLTKIAAFGPHAVYSVPPVSVSPGLTVAAAMPEWVPVRRRVRLGLHVGPEGTQPWRHPGPQGWSGTVVRWTDVRTGRSLTSTVRIQLPPVIAAGSTVDVPLGADLSLPDTAGAYTFQVSLPALGASSKPQAVEVRNTALPTSIDDARLLVATYSRPIVEAPLVVTSGEPIHLAIDATNVGGALWLATADHGRGVVGLGWRWRRDNHEVAELTGRAPIQYDVFPGQQSRFAVSIASPLTPGSYTLELGLVSEMVTWFAAAGAPPVRLAVEIRGPSEIGFASLVEGLRVSEIGAPRVTIAPDGIRHRAGAPVHLRARLQNAQRPWVVDAYLILEGPHGGLWFYDGQRLVVYDRNRWTRLGESATLHAGARVDDVVRGVPLAGLAPGDYTWHLLVTEGGTRRVIANAQAHMEVLP